MSSNENTRSKYLGENNNTDRHKLNFQNIGYIQTIPLEDASGWNRFNYAINTIEGLT